jgi:hypothetical protein
VKALVRRLLRQAGSPSPSASLLGLPGDPSGLGGTFRGARERVGSVACAARYRHRTAPRALVRQKLPRLEAASTNTGPHPAVA